ncbi:MAG TPA: DUF4097 family beta strand repeat-containing protein [Gemmatimonadaceae bacterium]|nr:DUF4097 family beta strand repeat-containing protein [Gemmatimonadaceae bacterium]
MKAQIRWAALAAALTLPMLASAQVDRRDRVDGRTRIDTIVPLNANGTVDLSLISGTIDVSAWSRDQVKIEASTFDGTLRFSASRSRVGLRVEHEGRGRHRSSGRTIYKVVVPRGARLILATVSGPITAKGVGGEVDAESVSGSIEVEDARSLSFESVSGGVRARSVSGGASGESVSGHVILENVRGDVEAGSVSGPIRLSGIDGKLVHASTVSGSIHFSGTVDPAGKYEFESHSGTIRLALPANTGARLSLETFSGSFQSDFPVTLGGNDGPGPGRSGEARIGRGNARIEAQTFSGSILIFRGENRE